MSDEAEFAPDAITRDDLRAKAAERAAAALEAETNLEWWQQFKPTHQMFAELNDRQIALAEAKIKEPSISLVALGERFKLSPATVSKHLRTKAVVEYMERRREEIRAATHIYRERVIYNLLTEAERHGPGASHTARVRANELLGKELGMFVEKAEVRQKVSGRMEHDHRHAVKIYLPSNGRDPELSEPTEDDG